MFNERKKLMQVQMLKDIIHLFASENQKNHTKQSTDNGSEGYIYEQQGNKISILM